MLTDWRRLTLLRFLKRVATLAVLVPMIPLLVRRDAPFRFQWYIVGLGMAGVYAISAYQTVLKNRVRRAAAVALRDDYRRAR